MVILLVLGIVAALVAFAAMMISWTVHIDMVKEDRNYQYGRASYKTFKREFDKYDYIDDGWRGSLFNPEHGVYIHASVVRFNDIGMILRTPIDWLLACHCIRKYCKALDNFHLYDWDHYKYPQLNSSKHILTPGQIYSGLRRIK